MTHTISRAERLESLYTLRRRADIEISHIEAEIRAEAEVMRANRELNQKRGEPNARRRFAACGTDSGYYRHLRTLGESACHACKMAHRVAERERAERRRSA